MLTFRKSLIAAAVLVCFIFVLRSSHSTPTSITSSSAPDGSVLRNHQPPGSGTTRHQQPSQPLAPLRERLRYQFPYDLRSKFPAYIWQTWKYSPSSIWFHVDLRPAEASWTELNPGFVHEVIPDDTQRHLIKYLYAAVPEVYEAFDALPLAVLKADFFRYLILLARGGIYSDIDTTALKPVTEWLPPELDLSAVGLVVGIEADPDRPDWHEYYSRRIQFCQWTIQAKPGHPVLRDIVATITEDALRMKKRGFLTNGKADKTVVEFTGPGAWTDAVFRYLNNPDYFNIPAGETRNITYEHFTNQQEHRKVGDVVVLPITSFSPGVQQMGAEDTDHPMAFVQHDFGGMLPSLPPTFSLSDLIYLTLFVKVLGRQTRRYSFPLSVCLSSNNGVMGRLSVFWVWRWGWEQSRLVHLFSIASCHSDPSMFIQFKPGYVLKILVELVPRHFSTSSFLSQMFIF